MPSRAAPSHLGDIHFRPWPSSRIARTGPPWPSGSQAVVVTADRLPGCTQKQSASLVSSIGRTPPTQSVSCIGSVHVLSTGALTSRMNCHCSTMRNLPAASIGRRPFGARPISLKTKRVFSVIFEPVFADDFRTNPEARSNFFFEFGSEIFFRKLSSLQLHARAWRGAPRLAQVSRNAVNRRAKANREVTWR